MEQESASEGCARQCDEEWPAPDPNAMKFLIGSNLSYLIYGGYIVARRRPRWLPLWLAGLVSWFILCKYLICTRCERYGEACDFYYLGKWASRLFERQPDKTLDTAGIVAEGSSVAVLQLLPVAASLSRRRFPLLFLVLFVIGQAAQLSICCKRCVMYSKDPWKRDVCPSYKQAKWLFSGRLEQSS